MKKVVPLLSLFSSSMLLADPIYIPLELKFNGIVHSEKEWMNPEKKSGSVVEDTNSFTSFYGELSLRYDFHENFNIMLGGKTNQVVSEEKYQSTTYLSTKMGSEKIDTTLLNEASLNYDNGLLALNLGRQEVSFDWLRGSIDGALGMVGNDNSHSLRVFWLNNYYQLQYNYESEIENINNNEGMYGVISKNSISNFELNGYLYRIDELRDIYGGSFTQLFDSFGYSINHTEAKPLSLALYDYHETFTSISADLMVKRNLFQLGYSQTGKNGLLAMLQMGNEMYGQFYLGNQVDRENAENFYLKYISVFNNIRVETVLGTTNYDNNFFRREKDLSSYEMDVYLTYQLSKNFSMDFGAMHMSVDEKDPLQVTQSAMMMNMVVEYEIF